MHTENPYRLSLLSHRAKSRNAPLLGLLFVMNGGGK